VGKGSLRSPLPCAHVLILKELKGFVMTRCSLFVCIAKCIRRGIITKRLHCPLTNALSLYVDIMQFGGRACTVSGSIQTKAASIPSSLNWCGSNFRCLHSF